MVLRIAVERCYLSPTLATMTARTLWASLALVALALVERCMCGDSSCEWTDVKSAWRAVGVEQFCGRCSSAL